MPRAFAPMLISSLDSPLYPDVWSISDWYDPWCLKYIENCCKQLDINDFIDFQDTIKASHPRLVDEAFGKRNIIQLPPLSAEKCLRAWEDHRPDRLRHIDSSMINIEERIQSVWKNYSYPSHTDSPRKMLTMIIYVLGQDGTEFMGRRNREEDAVEIPFKQNSGYFFFPDGETTWHRFKNCSSSIRSTVVVNIVLKNQYVDVLLDNH